MKRNLLLALAVMSALGVATSGANAQSDEKKDEKKSEQSQLMVQQGQTAKPVLVADDDKKDTPKPELIAEDEKEKPKPELISQSDEKQEKPKPELITDGGGTFPDPDSSKGYFELIAEGDEKETSKPELIS